MTRAFLLAGESSGDLHGALLARELRRQCPGIHLCGVGGPKMAAEGVELILSSRELAVVGLVEVLNVLPRILGAYQTVSEALAGLRPDVFVPIDLPDFNFRLLRRSHRLGIPIAYYISPQLWAWRSSRVELVRRYVQRMIVIFPFEAEWYAERGVDVTWVGHPLLDVHAETLPFGAETLGERRARVREESFGPTDEGDGPCVAVLPGSRHSELRRIGPILAAARRRIDTERAGSGRPAIRWILGRAPFLDDSDLRVLLDTGPWTECSGWVALSAADLALLASGTATMEGLLLGTPMVVVYRISPVTYQIARRLIKVDHIAMANLVAGRGVVPEFVQADATPEAVADCAARLLDDDEARARMETELLGARETLGESGAPARAAQAVLEVIEDVREAKGEQRQGRAFQSVHRSSTS